MYKLLIADDNLLIRNQLRNFIDWDKYEIEVVALEDNLDYVILMELSIDNNKYKDYEIASSNTSDFS